MSAAALIAVLLQTFAFAGGQKTAPELARGQAIVSPNAPAIKTSPQLPPATALEVGLSPGLSPTINVAEPGRFAREGDQAALVGVPLSMGKVSRAHGRASVFAAPVQTQGVTASPENLSVEKLSASVAHENTVLTRALENPSAPAETLAVDGDVVFDGNAKKDASSAPMSAVSGRAGARSRLAKGRKLVGATIAGALTLAAASPAYAQGAALHPQAASGIGVAAGVLGLVLGMRHALDPDHVIALLNLVTGAKTRWKGWRLGALWGLGHSLSLFVVGGGVVLAKAAIPDNVGAGLESLVALMLIGLGAASIARERKTAAHGHYHDLGALKLRPFFIGLVHGLAGSGAVALLALAAVPGTLAGFLYLAAFGFGTILGMSVVTLFIQALAVRLVSDPKIRGRVALAAGLFSAAFGVFMLYELIPLMLGHRL